MGMKRLSEFAPPALNNLDNARTKEVPTDASLPACPMCSAPARALSEAAKQERTQRGGRWALHHLDHLCDCVFDHAWEYQAGVARLHAAQEGRHAYLETLPARYRRMLDKPLEATPGLASAMEAADRMECGEFLFLFGTPGIGKTHLAVQTAARLIGSGAGAFWTAAGALDAIKRSYGDRHTSPPDLAAPDVLVLDDLGKERPTAWAAEQLYTALDKRFTDARTTIVTSNYPPHEASARLFPEDEPTAAAFLSRLVSDHVAQVRGQDHRTEHHR